VSLLLSVVIFQVKYISFISSLSYSSLTRFYLLSFFKRWYLQCKNDFSFKFFSKTVSPIFKRWPGKKSNINYKSFYYVSHRITNLLILKEHRNCCTMAINKVNCFVVPTHVTEIILTVLSVSRVHTLFPRLNDDFTLSAESPCIDFLRFHFTNYIFFVLISTSR